MKSFLKSTLVASAVALSASAFAAGPVTVDIDQSTFQSLTTDSVLPSAGSWVEFTLNGIAGGDLAIELDASVASIGSFAAYCTDLSKALVTPGKYTFSDTQVDSIGRLFAVAGFNGNDWAHDGVSGFQTSALQVAIWEVSHDSLATANLDSGNLVFTAINSNVKSQAQAYLTAAAALSAGQYSPDVRAFTSVGGIEGLSQPLVTAVPEPSTYAMIAACLGAVGLVSRRKSA